MKIINFIKNLFLNGDWELEFLGYSKHKPYYFRSESKE